MQLYPLIHRAIGPILEKERQAAGRCGKNEEKALLILGDHGPMIASRLGDCLDLRHSSLTSLVDRLEAQGLVRRRPDAHDRRKVLIEPSDEGRAYTEARRERLRAAIAETLMRLEPMDRLDLERGLEAAALGLGRLADHNKEILH